jgi:hypothetical protein
MSSINRELPVRVFISYTAKDLAAHADVVAAVLRKLQVLAIDHRDSGATGQPSVKWCMEEIEKSDIVIVLLAHRYGWIPTVDVGGDGQSSITWLEVKSAQAKNKIVLPYLIDEGARWPTDMVEGLTDVSILPRLSALRAQLSQSVAGFFTDPSTLDGPVSRDVPKAIQRLRSRSGETTRKPSSSPNVTGQVVPWIYDRENPPSISDRMEPHLPKRVLCIDDFSADGAVTLAYMERIERLLQLRYDEEDFRLSDYFDLITGSGFGAIAATEIALGRTVAQARDFAQLALTKRIEKRTSFPKWLKHRYEPGPLANCLSDRYGQLSLAASEFQTGLALVATQLEVGRPCHFTNHPRDPQLPQNSLIPLSHILLGCVSPLMALPPVMLSRNNSPSVVLTSAEVSGATNPSLYLLLLVTNPEFPFAWRLGTNRLYLVSAGSCWRQYLQSPESVVEAGVLEKIRLFSRSSIQGANYMSDLLLAGLSRSALEATDGPAEEASALTLRRVDIELDASLLESLGMGTLVSKIENMNIWDSMTEWDNLDLIGQEAARLKITKDFFSPSFDVRITRKAIALA